MVALGYAILSRVFIARFCWLEDVMLERNGSRSTGLDWFYRQCRS